MSRPRSARVNIAWAMGSKVISMAVAVLSVPILLRLLGTEDYGTWVTLTSLIAFVSLLDLGVGNNLRNAVASAQDAPALESARLEFVGFFQLLACVGLAALLVLGVASLVSPLLSANRATAAMLFVPPLLLLPLMLSANVLQGFHATGIQVALQSSGGWLFFALMATLAWADQSPALPDLALAWSCLYVLVLLVTFVLAVRLLHLPSRRLLQWSLASLPKARLKVGLEFLALQLSSLILYSLGNALIYHQLGAGEVARYDVLNKIFQVGLSFYTIVIGVMWSEIARHRAREDADALMRILRRLALVALGFCLAAAAVACLAPWVIDHWTKHRLQVSSGEAFAVAALVSLQSVAYVGAVFMNAFEQIRAQVVLASVSIVLMIPLSSVLMDRGLGIAAVPLAAMVLTILPAVVCNHYALQLVRSLRRQVAVA